MLAADIDAELGLITCVWDRPDGPLPSGVAQGFNLIPVSGVREAAGGVSEAVGDEKIGGEGTFNKDMSNDGMIFEAHKQIVKPLSQTWSHLARAGLRNEKTCVCVRTVSCYLYTSRRVHGSCYCLDAKIVRKNKKSEKCSRLRMESGFR